LGGATPDDADDRFSLVAGGPFHGLLRGLGLIGGDVLPTRAAALALAALAWLPPALLSMVQSLATGVSPDIGFLSDPTVHTRYLLAVWVLVATERYADHRLVLLTRQFAGARLVSEQSVPAFRAALLAADRRAGSWVAEGVLLTAALLWSTASERYVVSLAGTSWEGSLVQGEIVLSWAGQYARFISNPLFLFLVLRWLWRFVVWTALLFRISRLSLQLAPLHPDRSAGLGFLSIYPGIFSGVVFALSCVIAASFTKALALTPMGPETVWYALATWVGFVLVLFCGPLFVFVRPLYLVRERALLDYGRLAHQHHLAFHRGWILQGRSGEELLGSADPSSASDLNASFDAVRTLRLVPLDASAIVQLGVAVGIPLLAVVATQIPLIELAQWIVGALL